MSGRKTIARKKTDDENDQRLTQRRRTQAKAELRKRGGAEVAERAASEEYPRDRVAELERRTRRWPLFSEELA